MLTHARFGTKNYSKLVRFVKFLGQFLQRGMAPLKHACHFWRARALDHRVTVLPGDVLRKDTTPARSLFVASTLSRAVYLPAGHLMKDATSKAVERWTGLYEMLEESLEKRLRDYSFNLFRRQASNTNESGSALAPLVASKACVERSASEGGCIAALRELHIRAQRCLFDKANPQEFDPLPGQERGERKGSSPKMRLEHLARIATGAGRKIVPTSPLLAYQTSRFYASRFHPAGKTGSKITLLPDSIRRKTVKPICIEELGQKVRVATMHPAALAHFSRCMAQRTMPLLKRERVFRKILHGDSVTIRGVKTAEVYSADLSAASDYIDHKLGQAVLTGMADALGINGVTRKALMNCLGPMEVELPNGQKTVTRSGAHMGLGTTWTVLCVMNHWAASMAGPTSSFAICGDDLVAAWTDKQVEIYDESIRRLGLVQNKDKSYRGKRGVFCELLMEPVRPGVFSSTSLPRLAEITLARGPLAESRQELTKLLKGNLLKPTRQTIEIALKRGKRPSGPIAAGGDGTPLRTLDAVCLLQQYLVRGKVRDQRVPPEVAQLVRRLAPDTSTVPQEGAIHISDAVVSSLCSLRESQVAQGQVEKPLPVSDKIRAYKGKARTSSGYRALQERGILLTQRQVENLVSTSAPQKGNAPRLPKAGSVFVDCTKLAHYFLQLLKEAKHLSWRTRQRVRKHLRSLPYKQNLATLAYLLEEVTKSTAGRWTTEQELRAALLELGLYTAPTSQNGTQGSCRWERGANHKG
ncbi:RNA-dependent RNA polymerase [Rhizopus oryzae narnavirus 1]|nr:RNA-dependent RNA polymerase [Rhizopus oryzae narnavirus 1]